MDSVWVMMSLDTNEGRLDRQPLPSVFATKESTIRTLIEVGLSDIDEDGQENQRVEVEEYARSLGETGSCFTPDKWFISLTEEQVES